MAFNFYDLDQRTRELMVEEIDRDVSSGSLYISPRLSPAGAAAYPELFKAAVLGGTEATLAGEFRRRGILNATETKRTPKGGTTEAAVPVTAPDTLAEGEFNRFYIRAVCRRALEQGQSSVVVYRAKEVANARSASLALIGQAFDAQKVLDDLRQHIGVDTALGLPQGPNSGLSVRL
jgi:hypothetical protein